MRKTNPQKQVPLRPAPFSLLAGISFQTAKRGSGICSASPQKDLFSGELCAEVAFQQTGEGFAVAGFVAGHFVNGVVDGVETGFFGELRQIGLALRGAVFGGDAEFEVLLRRIGHDFTEQLGELRGVFRFFLGVFGFSSTHGLLYREQSYYFSYISGLSTPI